MKRQLNDLHWHHLWPAFWKSCLATLLMAVACWGVLGYWETATLIKLIASLIAAIGVYLLTAKAVSLEEPFELLRIRKPK